MRPPPEPPNHPMLALLDCPPHVKHFIECAKYGESCEVVVSGKSNKIQNIGSVLCHENITGQRKRLLFTCKNESECTVRVRIDVVMNQADDVGG